MNKNTSFENELLVPRENVILYNKNKINDRLVE